MVITLYSFLHRLLLVWSVYTRIESTVDSVSLNFKITKNFLSIDCNLQIKNTVSNLSKDASEFKRLKHSVFIAHTGCPPKVNEQNNKCNGNIITMCNIM